MTDTLDPIETVVIAIAEMAGANAEQWSDNTSAEDVKAVLNEHGVKPVQYDDVAAAMVKYIEETSERWTINEVKAILSALKQTPEQRREFGAKVFE